MSVPGTPRGSTSFPTSSDRKTETKSGSGPVPTHSSSSSSSTVHPVPPTPLVASSNSGAHRAAADLGAIVSPFTDPNFQPKRLHIDQLFGALQAGMAGVSINTPVAITLTYHFRNGPDVVVQVTLQQENSNGHRISVTEPPHGTLELEPDPGNWGIKLPRYHRAPSGHPPVTPTHPSPPANRPDFVTLSPQPRSRARINPDSDQSAMYGYPFAWQHGDHTTSMSHSLANRHGRTSTYHSRPVPMQPAPWSFTPPEEEYSLQRPEEYRPRYNPPGASGVPESLFSSSSDLSRSVESMSGSSEDHLNDQASPSGWMHRPDSAAVDTKGQATFGRSPEQSTLRKDTKAREKVIAQPVAAKKNKAPDGGKRSTTSPNTATKLKDRTISTTTAAPKVVNGSRPTNSTIGTRSPSTLRSPPVARVAPYISPAEAARERDDGIRNENKHSGDQVREQRRDIERQKAAEKAALSSNKSRKARDSINSPGSKKEELATTKMESAKSQRAQRKELMDALKKEREEELAEKQARVKEQQEKNAAARKK